MSAAHKVIEPIRLTPTYPYDGPLFEDACRIPAFVLFVQTVLHLADCEEVGGFKVGEPDAARLGMTAKHDDVEWNGETFWLTLDPDSEFVGREEPIYVLTANTPRGRGNLIFQIRLHASLLERVEQCCSFISRRGGNYSGPELAVFAAVFVEAARSIVTSPDNGDVIPFNSNHVLFCRKAESRLDVESFGACTDVKELCEVIVADRRDESSFSNQNALLLKKPEQCFLVFFTTKCGTFFVLDGMDIDFELREDYEAAVSIALGQGLAEIEDVQLREKLLKILENIKTRSKSAKIIQFDEYLKRKTDGTADTSAATDSPVSDASATDEPVRKSILSVSRGKGDSPKSIRTQISLLPDVKAALKAASDAEGVSTSVIIDEALRSHPSVEKQLKMQLSKK